MRNLFLVTSALAALTGCAAPAPLVTRPEPVLCINRGQCDAMWSRAQLFVVQKTTFRLQIVTESVIETHGPITPYDTALGFTITRELAADGSGIIRLATRCGQAAQCLPSPTLAGQQFREYLISAP